MEKIQIRHPPIDTHSPTSAFRAPRFAKRRTTPGHETPGGLGKPIDHQFPTFNTVINHQQINRQRPLATEGLLLDSPRPTNLYESAFQRFSKKSVDVFRQNRSLTRFHSKKGTK
jgi:hypothetical protein